LKYLIVVLVVALVIWLMLRGRERGVDQARRRTGGRGEPQAMIVCAHCGVHLPRAEALVDQGGAFCSEAHKLAGPRRR